MAGTFRYTVWDPFMILCQMATLQCAYYVSLGLWIFFFDVIAGIPRSLDHIFKYEVGGNVNHFLVKKIIFIVVMNVRPHPTPTVNCKLSHNH